MYKPILFSTEMVNAILDGRKTQTRRIIKPQHTNHRWNNIGWLGWDDGHGYRMKPLRKYKKRIIRAAEEPAQMPEKTVRKLKTMREKAEFIRRNCIKLSYGQLKQETGLSNAEIRRIDARQHEHRAEAVQLGAG